MLTTSMSQMQQNSQGGLTVYIEDSKPINDINDFQFEMSKINKQIKESAWPQNGQSTYTTLWLGCMSHALLKPVYSNRFSATPSPVGVPEFSYRSEFRT